MYQDNKDTGYKKLKVWEEAHKLCLHVYKITKDFPKEEMYGLTSQIRRAALSVVANIVEGQSRTRSEFYHFLIISNGSLSEVEYYLEISLELGYIERSSFAHVAQQRQIVGKLLYGLIKSVKLSKKNYN
jgi:four helix bundle protein